MFQGECQTKAVLYQAAEMNETTKEVQTYVGLTENTFKTRYLNHTSSFHNKSKRKATELSKHIWKLTLLRRHVPNISRKRLMASILSIVRYNSASVHRTGPKIPPFDSTGNYLFEYLNIIGIQSNLGIIFTNIYQLFRFSHGNSG